MDQFFTPAIELGGTVFVTVAFIWYLTKRDKDLTKMMANHLEYQEKSNLKLAKSLQKLTDVLMTLKDDFKRIINKN